MENNEITFNSIDDIISYYNNKNEEKIKINSKEVNIEKSEEN